MDFDPTSHPAAALRTFGFVVLRQFFDPRPLAPEIDRARHDGLTGVGFLAYLEPDNRAG